MNIVKFSEVYAQKRTTFQSGIRQETPEAELRKILTLVFSNKCILLYGFLHVINGKISSLENDICCEVWLNKEHLEKKKCFKSGQREHAIKCTLSNSNELSLIQRTHTKRKTTKGRLTTCTLCFKKENAAQSRNTRTHSLS